MTDLTTAALAFVTQARTDAGWRLSDSGWLSPDGLTEDEWRNTGKPFPEELADTSLFSSQHPEPSILNFMGWLFYALPTSKLNYVQEILARKFAPSNPDALCTLLDHSLRDNCLWVLAKPQSMNPFIILFLLKCRDGCWGYKAMEESWGPYCYSCPLHFLDQAPEPDGANLDHGGSGKSWRDHVREYHASETSAPAPAGE